MEKKTLTEDIGQATKGSVYIRGLYGVPDFPEYKNTSPSDWWWRENSAKEDNKFLPNNVFPNPNV